MIEKLNLHRLLSESLHLNHLHPEQIFYLHLFAIYDPSPNCRKRKKENAQITGEEVKE